MKTHDAARIFPVIKSFSLRFHQHKSIPAFAMLWFLIALPMFASSQGIWTDAREASIQRRAERPIVPQKYRIVKADIPVLQQLLGQAPLEGPRMNARKSPVILELPMPDGSMSRFSIIESPVMVPELAAKYPEIKTYLGQGIDDPYATLRCDFTPQGFHASILSPDGAVFIDPYQKQDTEHYISYYKHDFIPPPGKIMIENSGEEIKKVPGPGMRAAAIPSGTELRTYRLALACDSNYYNFQGGTDLLVMGAVTTSINRVNQVYEAEVAIRMVMIANTDQLFFNGSTSPYPFTATGACDLRPQNQAAIDGVVGNAAYDIGHLFAMSAGGCATYNSVCNSSLKAWGVTGTSNPVGDPFDIDYVCHEMGHQFNAAHTWNGTRGFCTPDQYESSSAYEPGSGSTIMGYAGICSVDDLQPHSDPYFHTRSFDQIVAYSTTSTGNSCPVVTATGNNYPSVNAGSSYTIPISTPFVLTGSGSDPDGDALTYCWEEFDLGPAGPPDDPTTTGPIFRSFNPVPSPSRTFPKLSDILGNTTTVGEVLPAIGRVMTFRLTARDNRAGGGGVNYDATTVTVDGSIGPFAITSFNSSTTLCPGSQTVTWSVNGSDALAANVDILLSYDGGNTFPLTLAANTPNDGSQEVTIPCTYNTTARIKVAAVGNIFFDISNADLTVGDNTPPTFTDPADITIYTDDNCEYDASTSVTGDVTDEADNCSTGLDATSSDSAVDGACEGETIITRTWTLTDNCGNSTVNYQTITVADTTSPTFTAPPDITVYQDENCEHDASLSTTGDVTDEADNCDPSLDAGYTDAVTVNCTGDETITRTWTLTDDCGNSVSHVQVIAVEDTLGPVITNVAPDTTVLWPPDHTLRDVVINYTSVDNCSTVTNVLSVTSNEPINGGADGNTAPDWIIIDDHHLQLRAERMGSGPGRVYTITITSTDDCGNTSTATTEVLVPHDLGDVLYAKPQTNTQVKFVVEISPNPSQDNFNITLQSSDLEQEIHLTVYDIYGRTVDKLSGYSGSTYEIGSAYLPGSYFVRVTQGSARSVVRQLVKVR